MSTENTRTQKEWNYIEKQKIQIEYILSSSSGVKVMIYDNETTKIASQLITPTEMYFHETYLFQNIIHKKLLNVSYAVALCFLSTNQESIDLLAEELKSPHFKEYYVYFTNELTREQIKQLAVSDHFQCVRNIETIFMNTIAVTNNIFTLSKEPNVANEDEYVDQIVQSLKTLCVSLNENPYLRYGGDKDGISQKIVAKLEKEMEKTIKQLGDSSQLKDGKKTETALIVVDRMFDSLTPLLMNDSFTSISFECLDLDNNLTTVRKTKTVKTKNEKGEEIEQQTSSTEKVTFSYLGNEIIRKYFYTYYANVVDLIRKDAEEFDKKLKEGMAVDNEKCNYDNAFQNYPILRKQSKQFEDDVALARKVDSICKHRQLEHIFDYINFVFTSSLPLGVSRTGTFEDYCLSQLPGLNKSDPYGDKLLMGIATCFRFPEKIRDIVKLIIEYGVKEEDAQICYRVPEFIKSIPVKLIPEDNVVENISKKATEFFNRAKTDQKKFFHDIFKHKEKEYVPGLIKLIEYFIQTTIFTKESNFKEYLHTITDEQTFGTQYHNIIIYVVGGVTYYEDYMIHQLLEEIKADQMKKGQTGVLPSILLGGDKMLKTKDMVELLRKQPTKEQK